MNYLTPQDRLDIANDPVSGLERVAERIAKRAMDRIDDEINAERLRDPSTHNVWLRVARALWRVMDGDE